MKAKALLTAMNIIAKTKRPVFLWGAPGIGKSSITRQFADANGRKLIDIRATQLDPVDLRGLMQVVNGRTQWCPPSFLPDGPGYVMFLDELPNAAPMVKAALYQLVLDRRLGEYELPEDCLIIAAGNRESDRAFTTPMPAPLANRFIHLDLEADAAEWIEHAIKMDYEMRVIAYIAYRPEMVFKFDPKKDLKSFPTPRSWEFVSDVIKGWDGKVSCSTMFEVVKGAVGEAAALDFWAFVKVMNELPDLDDVLVNASTFAVPQNGAVKFAMVAALVGKATAKNVSQCFSVMERLGAEFAYLFVAKARLNHSWFEETAAFVKWAASNAKYLI